MVWLEGGRRERKRGGYKEEGNEDSKKIDRSSMYIHVCPWGV